MDNFKIVKHGYSQIEVDSYIDRLKYDYESHLAEQKDRIFYLKDQLDKITNSTDNELMSSLVCAVERAKVIENSSKNIYELETKKLNMLYQKMEMLLKDEEVNIDRIKREEFLQLVQDCRNSLQNNIQAQRENIIESTTGDPIKKLLSKMIGFNKVPVPSEENRPQIKVVKKKEQSQSIEKSNLNERTAQKVISSPSAQNVSVADKNKKQDGKLKPDLAEFDRFLSKGKASNGANFESIMFSQKSNKTVKENEVEKSEKHSRVTCDLSPNATGFDLKEAVNPKDDLSEIMKAFDFYNDNKKKN
ncbi:MAG: hypothetical protein EOM55_02070 [Clostridia bacterium]|nr:hypothetical protein [Clostridia bacterium]